MEDKPEYEKDLKDIEKFEERSPTESMPVPVGNSLISVMQIAIQKNYAPEFIEKMMDLQERYEANQAKRAFHIAMAKFKANPPKIWRDMQVKYEVGTKTTEWSHADLATAGEAINKALGENGLNSTWRTLPLDNNRIRVTCIIAHELGHSEKTYLESGPDTTGSKNEIQALGSAVFYLERYTLFALTGLAPARMDDDGKGAEIEYINDKQLSSIVDMINAKEADEAKFLKYMKIESLNKMLVKDFNKAMSLLKAKKKPARQPGE